MNKCVRNFVGLRVGGVRNAWGATIWKLSPCGKVRFITGNAVQHPGPGLASVGAALVTAARRVQQAGAITLGGAL